MSLCECPFELEDWKECKRKYSSSREVVWRQLSASGSKNRKRRFKAFLEECRFDLVKNVFLELGAVEVDYKSPWIVTWTEGAIPMERFTKMKAYQKVNHFPGMSEICKKSLLASNLQRMKKIFPQDYNYFPFTFCLPNEVGVLYQYCQKRKKQEIFIIKPDNNCQGSGIEIVKGINDVKKYRNVVCQKYITTPLLMDSFKLDLRLYVLVTSIKPLRIYVYKEGLVRLATVPYRKPSTSNMHEKRMHLTNYAVNRISYTDDLDEWERSSCKRSFSDLERFLDSLELSHDHLWPAVDGIIVKTILSALPNLQHMFHTSFPMPYAMSPCFEVLGFDVLLNNQVKPYLLEVNRSPSFGGSTAIDRHLKSNLLRNIIDMVLPTTKQIALLNNEQHLKAVRRLVNLSKTKQLTAKERIVAEYQEKREMKKMGNFRQVYPVDDGRYDEILRAVWVSSRTSRRGHSSVCPIDLAPETEKSITDGTNSDESD